MPAEEVAGRLLVQGEGVSEKMSRSLVLSASPRQHRPPTTHSSRQRLSAAQPLSGHTLGHSISFTKNVEGFARQNGEGGLGFLDNKSYGCF